MGEELAVASFGFDKNEFRIFDEAFRIGNARIDKIAELFALQLHSPGVIDAVIITFFVDPQFLEVPVDGGLRDVNPFTP